VELGGAPSTPPLRCAKDGGASSINFKLPELLGEDVLILVERLCELGNSLESIIAILNISSEKECELIL